MGKTISKNDRELKLSKRECDEIIRRKFGTLYLTKEKAKVAGMEWPLSKGWKRQLAGKLLGRKVHAKSATTPRKAKPAKSSKPASGSGFYSSWEWKKARYEALKRYHNRCQCCGWQPGDTAHGHLVVDHIKPRRKFPELELEQSNLQVLCNDCNMGKGGDLVDDWRAMDEAFKEAIRH